jgi:hypothetical protein
LLDDHRRKGSGRTTIRLPLPIADRVRVSAEPANWAGAVNIDAEAARYGGIALMGTIGIIWLLRPDGSLWEVDDDSGRPLTPLAAEWHVMALVAGSRRFPWLAELLPPRPDCAPDCASCGGKGTRAGTNVFCADCEGLGWQRPAGYAAPESGRAG